MTTPRIEEMVAPLAIQKEVEEYWGVHIGPKSGQHMQNKVLWKVVNKIWIQAHQAGDKDGYERGKQAGIDEAVEKIKQKKNDFTDHICRFNDSPQTCECYEKALDDTIKALQDNK